MRTKPTTVTSRPACGGTGGWRGSWGLHPGRWTSRVTKPPREPLGCGPTLTEGAAVWGAHSPPHARGESPGSSVGKGGASVRPQRAGIELDFVSLFAEEEGGDLVQPGVSFPGPEDEDLGRAPRQGTRARP